MIGGITMFGMKTRRNNLIANYLIGALVLTGLLALGFWYATGYYWKLLAILGAWIVSVNIASFGYYGYDKRRARIGSNRVPEFVLHSLTVLGGSIGSWIGMRYFRHKTIKGPFRFVFWTIVAFQIILIGFIVKYSFFA